MPGTDSHVHDDASKLSRGFRALLGEQHWAVLVAAGVPRTHRPGEFLLRQGDRGGGLFALTSGRVKVLAAEPDSSDVLLALRGAGDLVGEMAARENSERTATIQALDECTSISLPRAEFDRFLHNKQVYGVFSDYLVSKLSETVPYQVQQVHFAPRQRLARLLFEAFSLADSRHRDGRKIPFSQHELAKALGMARSTVAEQLAALREVGALGPGPRIVVENEDVLAEQARALVR